LRHFADQARALGVWARAAQAEQSPMHHDDGVIVKPVM